MIVDGARPRRCRETTARGCAKIAIVSHPRRAALVLALTLLAGCSEPATWYELGAPFAPEAPPPGQARIYVFWPAASPAARGVYHLAGRMEQLLPGGYLSDSAAPGKIRLQIGRCWNVGREEDFATAFSPGPELDLTTEAGRVYYLKVVPQPGLVDQLALEAVPAAAGGEIRGCRRLRMKPAAAYLGGRR